MRLATLDWVVIAVYCVTIVSVGLIYARRGGSSVDEFFLSGRSLPWFLTGTSIVASSFSCDTPLAVTGWVRDHGIWKNWLWWCFLVSGILGVFLFARWWRRGGVMTKAELAELRYGRRDGQVLRGVLGVFHSCITNTIILCWVLLAATKILDVLMGVEKLTGVCLASALALTYSLASGLWGVVVTDVPKFWLAMLGSVVLAVAAWNEVGGSAGVIEAAAANGVFPPEALSFLPSTGTAGVWTVPLAAVCVYLGVAWWAAENVDGGGVAVQRIAASRDERHGMLAMLWFNFAHYALRPWPWILVALASLVLVPPVQVTSPVDGVVTSVGPDAIVVDDVRLPLNLAGTSADWRPEPLPLVQPGAPVVAGAVLARTDSERAYVTMMGRYLPAGLLGLAIVGLMAAFMSTVDTHINVAASFFVNDVWRRFVRPDANAHHYVMVGRLACVGVMLTAGLLAWQARSISDLFLFFMSILGGCGPLYLARWVWWRVKAAHEIVAMLASAVTAFTVTFLWSEGWPVTPLTPGGHLAPEGRLCLVVAVSLAAVFLATPFLRRPDPGELLEFYRRVRPVGWWGPVAALAPDVERPPELLSIGVGVIGGLACIWGAMLATGLWLLDRGEEAAVAAVIAAAGTVMVWWALRRLAPKVTSVASASAPSSGRP